ncbi:photosynthesis system II assembly factor YCF48 family protein [Pseudomonas fluorescens]|uniref:Photosynthesis system II assembly factor YCF48 family protein n=1 Tax=Pseudomonas fluorescens TaxID=294 RepID=A0A0P8X3Q5_PSEFL|nr:YCF48-related protein [Pseudomonas fluorescens]KPU60434.1 photosynthesis system II assembly factor YCF48 family protein [Pseudomonas fluorescens]
MRIQIPRLLHKYPLRALLLSMLIMPACFSCTAVAQPDGLQVQPAITSAMAAQSVMLSVARAGQRLVAVGERGFIIVSDDNGNSWQQVSSPVSMTLVKVRFINDSEGWVVGHAGIVLHTQDGGLSWKKQFDGVQAAGIELQEAKRAIESSEKTEMAQEGLAQAQQLVDEGPDKPFLDLLFLDAKNGLVVGAYGLAFVTHDGGLSWQSIRSRIDNPSGLHLYSIERVGIDLFIAGEQGTLLRSSDEGQTFESLTSPYEGTTFGLQATNSGSILVFGLRGKAFESKDRGDTWQPLDTLQPVTLTSGLRLADGSVLLTDESGRVLRYADGDTKAAVLQIAQPSYFTGMAQAANGNLIISSARGMQSSAVAVDLPEHDQ